MEQRIALDGNPIVSINTNQGQFKIELFQDTAPLSAANFLAYVNGNDYASSIFHRAVPGFMNQAGAFKSSSEFYTDPTHTSTAQFSALTSRGTIPSEFAKSNLRGTVSMALSTGPNTASSSWFVNVANNSFLDSQQFTVFARVVSGMEVVDAINSMPTFFLQGISPVFNSGPEASFPVDGANQLAFIRSVVVNATILGTVYNDADGDGQQGQNEAGLAGLTVFVDANNNGTPDSNEVTATTDASGKYRLPGIDPGSYNVRIVAPGWTNTVPANGSLSVSVTAGQDATGRNFGLKVAAPSAPSLLTDTGASGSDGVTRLNNSPGNALSFSVAGVASGALVQILEGATVLGEATATGGTVTIVTNGVNPLADGSHSITARQTFSNVTSAISSALAFTVDATAPQFTSTAPTQIAAGAAYSYNAETPDEGQAGLVYSLVAFPAGMSVNAQTGLLSWTPNASQSGGQNVVLRATDLAGNTGDQSFTITVTNSAPTLTSLGSQTVDEQTELRLTVTATDPNLPSDNLFFSLGAGSPAGASINPTSGVLTWLPTEGDGPALVNIKIRVTDAGGLFDEKTLAVTVRETNKAPQLSPISRQLVAPGQTLTLTAQASDVDLPANALSFSLAPNSPGGSSIDPVTGDFSWTAPTTAPTGPVSFTVRVTDAGGLFSEQTFLVDVFDGSLALFAASAASSTTSTAVVSSALQGFLLEATATPLSDVLSPAIPPAILLSNAESSAVDFTIGANTGIPHTSEAMRLPTAKRVTANKPSVDDEQGVQTDLNDQPQDPPPGPSRRDLRRDLRDQGRLDAPLPPDHEPRVSPPLNVADGLTEELLNAALQAIADQQGSDAAESLSDAAETDPDILSEAVTSSRVSTGSIQALAMASVIASRTPRAVGEKSRRRCGVERLRH